MQTCEKCSTQNKAYDVYCYRCGHILPSVDLQATVKEPKSTRILKSQTERLVLPKKRWGTARLKDEALIIFTVKGNDNTIQVYLEDQEIVIGRTHGNIQVDVDLTPYRATEFGVSRRHALIKRQNDNVVVTDLGSSNNTYLNSHKLVPKEFRILRDGDELKLGRLVMNVHFGEESA